MSREQGLLGVVLNCSYQNLAPSSTSGDSSRLWCRLQARSFQAAFTLAAQRIQSGPWWDFFQEDITAQF